MKKMKAVNVMLLVALALWVVSSAGCCHFSGRSGGCKMSGKCGGAGECKKASECEKCASKKPAPDKRPAKVVVEGFELPAEGAETEWPGIISIFTRGGGYAGGNYLKAVKEAGFGAYHAKVENNKELREHGVKLFLWGRKIEEVAKLGKDDNILGYWNRYPTEPKEWEKIGEEEAELRKVAPNHVQFYAMDATWGEPEHYIKAIKPRVMWYRHYLWEGHHLNDDFKGAGWAPQNEFIYLERARKAALEAGIPIIRWVHAVEPVKLRRTISLSLVYGIRGFTWWQGWVFYQWGDKNVDKRGYPLMTETGKEVVKLNQIMKAYSPIYKKARCVAAGHSWPWPLGYGTLPQHWAALGGAHVTAGLFVDREANTYFVVGNRRIGEESTAIFTFSRPIDSVSIMDKETGKWKPVAMEKNAFGKDMVKIKIDKASVEMIWPQPTPDRYRAPVFGDAPKTFGGTTVCKLTAPVSDGVVRYTLDGSEPTKASAAYKKPLEISSSVTVNARFFHNDGRASIASSATYSKVEPVADKGASGLAMAEYKGMWSKLPDFGKLKAVKSGKAAQFALPEELGGKDGFGLVFTGVVRIPKDGTYTFYTNSDDGTKLYLGDGVVVNNDGGHGMTEKSGKVSLAAGLYPIRVEFFEGGGGEGLEVSYEGPGIKKQVIPAAALFLAK